MGRYGAFEMLRVAVLGDGLAAAYTAKLFGDLGAEVVRIGDRPADVAESFFGASQRTVDSADQALASADVVIEGASCDPIASPVEPSDRRQVVVRVTPFATTGPYSAWRSTDLVDAAIGGHLRLSGDPEREPLNGVPDLVHMAAGVSAFIGAVAALIVRCRTGQGQVVETSHQEVLVALHQFTLCRFTHNGAVLNRMGNRYAGPGAPIGGYECSDGWIGLALPQEDQMERMLEVTGLMGLLERDDVDSVIGLMTNPAVLDSELRPYLRTQSRDETVELFQALRLPCAPVSTVDDLLADEHLAARDFWHQQDDVTVPGAPFRLSGHGWSLGPKDRAGELVDGAESPKDLVDGPLTGIRVLDLTRVWAGPLASRLLADLGAEVLMSEVPWTRTPREVDPAYVAATHFFPGDEGGERPYNRSAFHNKYAINKLSTVIELDKSDGRDVFARLVQWADVLIENYSPRVMPGFGFGESELQRLNPDLVYVNMPGYGRSGPRTDWVAYGPTIDGHVGHTSLTGYLGEGPWKCGIAWPDPIAGLHAAAATLVALLDGFAAPDAKGQVVEVAQIEAAINMIGHHVVEAQSGTPPTRWGNRRPGRAPQGVYRCAGDDRWIAISIVDDEAWQGLCGLAGWPELVHLTDAQRWARHDELDRRIAELTSTFADIDLMRRLQAAGVPAGAVLAAPEVMSDPQLATVEMFVDLDHTDAGTHAWARFPVRLSKTPATMRHGAALMGEHNDYAVSDLAGIDDATYAELKANGVVRDEPPF